MLFCFLIVLFVYDVDSQSTKCTVVNSTILDLPKLDGRWYFAAVAMNLNKQVDCAMMDFSHKTNNTTDVSITWVVNNTASFYNGSVFLTDESGGDMLSVNYKDNRTVKYSVLGVDYEHYITLYACTDNLDGSIAYELWKLTRSLHLKQTDATKLDQAVARHGLENTTFVFFKNSEDSCKINAANHLNPATFVLTSAASIALLRRLY